MSVSFPRSTIRLHENDFQFARTVCVSLLDFVNRKKLIVQTKAKSEIFPVSKSIQTRVKTIFVNAEHIELVNKR